MSIKNKRARIGSLTATGGFLNEHQICEMFNDWKSNEIAKEWLNHMGYNPAKIEKVEAIHVPTRISKKDLLKYKITEEEYEETVRYKKADAQIKILIKIGNILKIENISLKKANTDSNFNQIDKRPVDTYHSMWNFDKDLMLWLKLFTGEIIPKNYADLEKKEYREYGKRLFIDEFPKRMQAKMVDFFEKNKILIISDIIKGRGALSASWILVTRMDNIKNKVDWILVDINMALNYFSEGEVKISPRGSLSLGKITMQRKGGTPDPTSLQFKINPLGLFDLSEK